MAGYGRGRRGSGAGQEPAGDLDLTGLAGKFAGLEPREPAWAKSKWRLPVGVKAKGNPELQAQVRAQQQEEEGLARTAERAKARKARQHERKAEREGRKVEEPAQGDPVPLGPYEPGMPRPAWRVPWGVREPGIGGRPVRWPDGWRWPKLPEDPRLRWPLGREPKPGPGTLVYLEQALAPGTQTFPRAGQREPEASKVQGAAAPFYDTSRSSGPRVEQEPVEAASSPALPSQPVVPVKQQPQPQPQPVVEGPVMPPQGSGIPSRGALLAQGKKAWEPLPPRPEPVDADLDGLGTIKKAFPDIARANELGSQASYDGHRILRGDKVIAQVIRKEGGAPAVQLDSFNGPGLWDKTVLGGGGKDVAVYLGGGGQKRKTPEQAREWKSQLIATVAKGPAPGAAARVDTPEGRAQLERAKELKRLGGLPDQIRDAVKRGDLPLGDGEEMMQKLWGKTLKPQDPRSEDSFREWILAQPEGARKAWFGAVSMGDVEAQNGIMNHYVSDWYVKNSNQPGVTRDLMQRVREDLTGKDARIFKEKFTAKVNGLNEFAASTVGSMAGMVGGLVEDEWNARMAPFSPKARAKLMEKMEIRGRGTKNWWRGALHFADKNNPFSDTGKKDQEAQYALGDLKRAIDVLDLQQNGWKAEDQKKIGEAMAAAREKVFALHEVDQEKGFEIRRDDVDAAKDPELFQALNDYVQTGDPNAWQRFRDRMFSDQGTRQQDARMNEKLKGMNPWQAAYTGGANASFAELGIEAAGMALTAGLGKALGAEMKLIKAAQGAGKGAARGSGALARIGAMGRGLAGAGEELGGFHRLGRALVPSAKLRDAAGNWLKEMALEAPVGAATEAITEAGDKRATGDSMLKAAGMGLLGEMAMGPVMSGVGRAVKEVAKLLPARTADAEFADFHRAQAAGNPEARELSQEDLEAATGPMDAERRKAIVAEYEAAQRERETARVAEGSAEVEQSTTPVGDARPGRVAGNPSATVAPAPQGERVGGAGDSALFPAKPPALPAEAGNAPAGASATASQDRSTKPAVDGAEREAQPAPIPPQEAHAEIEGNRLREDGGIEGRKQLAPVQDSAVAEGPPGDPAQRAKQPTPTEVEGAAKAPDARKRLGEVRAGKLHALEAYRFYNDKLGRKGRLSPEEQVTYDRAAQALAEAVGSESRVAETTTSSNRGVQAWRETDASATDARATGLGDRGRGKEYGAEVPAPSRAVPMDAGRAASSIEAASQSASRMSAADPGTAALPSRDAGRAINGAPATRADVHAAATAPDARRRLGDVRAGRLHALEAYRFLSDKLQKMGRLNPAETVTYERAAQALAEAVTKEQSTVERSNGDVRDASENGNPSPLLRLVV